MMRDDIYEQAEEFNKISFFRHPIKWLKMLAPFNKNWVDRMNLTYPSEYFEIKMLKQEFECEVVGILVISVAAIICGVFSIY